MTDHRRPSILMLSDEDEAVERAAFERNMRGFDLSKHPQKWSGIEYVHSHIEAIWKGWSLRAALSADRSQE